MLVGLLLFFRRQTVCTTKSFFVRHDLIIGDDVKAASKTNLFIGINKCIVVHDFLPLAIVIAI
ncbi:hypothetical protein D3C72_865810 [compost metagenome]